MSTDLRRLAGSTALIGFRGTRVDELAPLLRRLLPAGIVLLPRNVESAGQVSDLVSGAQECMADLGVGPLLVAVDQEGGGVRRLSAEAGFSDIPSAMTVGATGDLVLAEELARLVGRELRSVGINLDLAPVLDLALEPKNEVIGARSYGPDPELVGRFGAAIVRGLAAEGVLACAKHFPGHGSTAVDSHVALPSLDATVDQLRTRDLVPFRAAIAAGCAAVMTAHVLSALDPVRPATLSSPTIGLLRHELAFDGLVISDALEMKALASVAIPRPELGPAAIAAGVDLLIFEGDPDLIEATVGSLADHLARGDLESALALSRARLVRMRDRVGNGGRRDPIDRDSHLALTREVARAGLRIADQGRYLPLQATPVVVDVGRGREFGARVGWPVRLPADVAGTESPVVVISDRVGLDPSVIDALDAAKASGHPRTLVVLEGWQAPPGWFDVLVLADDLPPTLWPIVAECLTGSVPGVVGE